MLLEVSTATSIAETVKNGRNSHKKIKLTLKHKNKMKNPKYVPNSEAVTNKPFWESGVNPITMTRTVSDWGNDDDKATVYDYEY